MAPDDDIAERLIAVIIEELEVEEVDVHLESEFAEFGTSLELAALAVAVEEEFGIEIPDDDADVMETVRDAVEYLREHEVG